MRALFFLGVSGVAALGGLSICSALLCCVHVVQDGGLFAFVVVVKRLRYN